MKHINHKGFSLLEILLTITLLSILFAILVNSINPSNILSEVQDNQREADALTIYQALEQYALKNNTYPEAIKNMPNNSSAYICKTSAPNCNNTNQINLSTILVPTYLSKIPEYSTDTNNSGFYVVKDSNGKIGIGGVRRLDDTTFVKGLENQSFATAPTTPKLAVTSCTYADKKISISYTSGEVGYNYASQTINSTGVTGLTATLLGDGPLATGGDTVTDITVGTDTYRVHTFTTVGTSSLNVIQGGEFEYLVVGGGGGGGETIGGGGGGGQVKSGTLSLSSGVTYNTSTGAGGTGGFGTGYPGGVSGSSSSISGTGITTITSLGGGGGGGYNLTGTGSGGGNGGGQGAGGGAGVSAGSGQNAGGNSSSNTNSGAGGGGAGSVGSNSTSGNPGAGGIGISSDITGTSLFYAAGGGGGARNPSGGTGASGGSGVGGSGGTGATNGSSGANGTGSGGGGGGYRNSPVFEGAGGNGGSGIVVVRYKLTGVGTLASSGTLEYLVNGTPSGGGTANFNLSNISNIGVGCNNSNIAVNVTETVLDSNYNNVALLINGNGTNGSTSIIDSSSNSNTVAAFGNSQISNVQSKFGGSSVYFDGSGDYFQTATNAGLALGSGAFTIEAWVRPANTTAGYRGIVGDNVYSDANGFALYQNGTAIEIWFGGSPATRIINATNCLTAGEYQHIAWTRSSTGVNRLFVNGVQRGGDSTNSTNLTATTLRIGRVASGSSLYDFNGYIDDLRITKGVARYTSDFSSSLPAELPTSGNTLTY